MWIYPLFLLASYFPPPVRFWSFSYLFVRPQLSLKPFLFISFSVTITLVYMQISGFLWNLMDYIYYIKENYSVYLIFIPPLLLWVLKTALFCTEKLLETYELFSG